MFIDSLLAKLKKVELKKKEFSSLINSGSMLMSIYVFTCRR